MYLAHSIMGQTEEKKDTVLQGRTGPQISKVFPLTNDIDLKNNQYIVIYPLLMVNNVPIENKRMVDCFRNHFDRTKITKTKLISAKQAEKKGIPNVPKDGVLFVTTKKGYYFDFSCE
jgi:hypothetical protein